MSHTYKLTKEQKASIPREFLAGMSAPALARKYNISVPGVCWHLNKAGIHKNYHLPNDEETKTIRALHQSGHSARAIGIAKGFSRRVVETVLRRMGEYKSSRRRPNAEVAAGIVNAYVSGSGLEKSANQFGFTSVVSYRVLKDAGIRRRTQSEAKQIFTIDHTYFAVIDNPERAYWLGFISADAYICRNSVRCALGVPDRDHLVKMAAALGSNATIADEFPTVKGKQHHTCRLTMCSPHIVRDLKNLGVLPNKSLTIEPWSGPDDLMPHYWHGVWDGDGMIYKNPIRPRQWEVYLCGNEFMVSAFASFITKRIGVRWRTKKCPTAYYARYSGLRLPQTVMRLLHADAPVCLTRKKTLVDELLALKPRPGGPKNVYLTTQSNFLF